MSKDGQACPPRSPSLDAAAEHGEIAVATTSAAGGAGEGFYLQSEACASAVSWFVVGYRI